ncbi:HAEPLYID family protein [Chryseobacterium sp. C39-AII1]|uniref:HAEPLYID family protein n=1 Tax=Chryseobacterium sp. C39-AII1 TaxID=3080332 RepID=UPI003209607E
MKSTQQQFIIILALFLSNFIFAQTNVNQPKPVKISHAEPLYADLVRDLGARKGEKEFNLGAGFINHKGYSEYSSLVEYEFAPVNRLGLEVEADFSFFRRSEKNSAVPGDRLENLRFSMQYSFFVSEKINTTLAAGYTQVFEFTDFKNYGKNNLFTGTIYNPFVIAAKKWGSNFHTLMYAGPLFKHNFDRSETNIDWQINTSFIYTIPGSGHFVGVEFNKEFDHGKFEMTIRPQVKIKINKKLALGAVAGIPVHKEEGFSSFFRVIIEP